MDRLGINLSVNLLIVVATVIVSLMAFNDRNFKYKLTLSPYSVKHHKRWWLTLTHTLVHGDYMHLALNMYVLYSFGSMVENVFVGLYGEMTGRLYYLALYVGGALFATIPSLRKHSDNPGYLAVGASGAVSAVVFAFILIAPLQKLGIIFIPIHIPGFIFGTLYLIAEHYMGKRGNTGIAHDAHISGAIFGLVFLSIMDYHFIISFFTQISYWVTNTF